MALGTGARAALRHQVKCIDITKELLSGEVEIVKVWLLLL